MNEKLPVVFSPGYDIKLLGIERLHPFDSSKYGRVFNRLQESGMLARKDSWYVPEEVSEQLLKEVHSEDYLASLNQSSKVAAIAELPLLRFVPNFLVRRNFLKPMRLATGGTLLAAGLAAKYGWAINLSGGYHHAGPSLGHGFCVYADIPLATMQLQKVHPDWRFLVVDLDAHQGDGLGHCFGRADTIAILDIYNGDTFPRDFHARQFIRYDYPVRPGIRDEEYLGLLHRALPEAITEFQPDFLFFNAGSDIFSKDPLGGMGISREGITQRDEFVFREALKRKIPVCMVLSGGYTQESAGIISDSILNIHQKVLPDFF